MNPLGWIGEAFNLLAKVLPDPVARAEAQAKLLEMQNAGKFKEEEFRYNAIVAEASSSDKWTSRARPSFMYVFYIIILWLAIVVPLVGLYSNEAMSSLVGHMKDGLAAIPDAMWATFTAGYLGYTTFRGLEKIKGAAK